MNQKSFLKSHISLINNHDRLRVGKQLQSILIDWYGGEKILSQLTVLDYGCSTGVITNLLASCSKKVVGIDIDSIAIQKAKRKYKSKNLTFLVSKKVKTSLKDQSFNLVICNQVYSYVTNPDLMMNEIFRLLKTGGVCLFTGDNLIRPIEPLYPIPFIRLLPQGITIFVLKLLGYKNIYTGTYLSYWGLQKLFRKFKIYDYTIKVLRKPKKFRYKKLEKYSSIINMLPQFMIKIIEPFLPSFIFILKK